MFHKTLVITGTISVILISAIFVILFFNASRGMEEEMRKTERYIMNTAANGVRTIRNEILYLFQHYSDEIEELNEEGWDGDPDSLILSEEYQLEDFPSIVQRVEYMKPGEIWQRYHVSATNDIEPRYQEILGKLSQNALEDRLTIIHIYDFNGYMIFPLKEAATGEYEGFLIFFIDITSVVEDYLVERLSTELHTSEEKSVQKRDLEYSLVLQNGSTFKDEDLDNRAVIDLNRDFNLFNLRDYYYTRPDSFVPVPQANTVTDNHTYLIISHEEADPGAMLWMKIRVYAGLTLLYLFLIGVLMTFLWSVSRIKKEYQREQQFTSLISHELKTPLSVIRLASDSLAGGYVEGKEDVAEYGSMIKDETLRLGRMIENILLISTLSWKGRNMEQVALPDLIEDLHRENASLLKSREIIWEEDNRAGQIRIDTRPVLLKAALQNVIHNGISYGAAFSEDRKIILRVENGTKMRREGILFSIIDHGPGISWSESQKIFSNYYRGKEVSEKQLPGSGMGLALSKRIAEGLGGSLTLNRSMKKETLFEFWIPVRKNSEENIDD